MIHRLLEPLVLRKLKGKRKVLCLFGPRQVGKTTLLRSVASQIPGEKLILTGDFLDDRQLLRPERGSLASLLAGQDFLFLDEAQNID